MWRAATWDMQTRTKAMAMGRKIAQRLQTSPFSHPQSPPQSAPRLFMTQCLFYGARLHYRWIWIDIIRAGRSKGARLVWIKSNPQSGKIIDFCTLILAPEPDLPLEPSAYAPLHPAHCTGDIPAESGHFQWQIDGQIEWDRGLFYQTPYFWQAQHRIQANIQLIEAGTIHQRRGVLTVMRRHFHPMAGPFLYLNLPQLLGPKNWSFEALRLGSNLCGQKPFYAQIDGRPMVATAPWFSRTNRIYTQNPLAHRLAGGAEDIKLTGTISGPKASAIHLDLDFEGQNYGRLLLMPHAIGCIHHLKRAGPLPGWHYLTTQVDRHAAYFETFTPPESMAF